MGCGEAVKPTQMLRENPDTGTSQPGERFTVTRVGVFEDRLAFNEKRGVYQIRDNKTGKEYVGVSGVGIAEIGEHQQGKVIVEDER